MKLDANQIKKFVAFAETLATAKSIPALYSDAALVVTTGAGIVLTKKGRNLIEKARADGLIKS